MIRKIENVYFYQIGGSGNPLGLIMKFPISTQLKKQGEPLNPNIIMNMKPDVIAMFYDCSMYIHFTE